METIGDWLATCEAAARAGGEQLQQWQGRFRTREKGVCDLVTDADLASQEAIRAVIQERFPHHAFVAEEGHEKGLCVPPPDQLVWVVDPLDGTTNYVHGYPQYAVSVALVRGAELQVGVIYDPVHEQCYSAAASLGAWCNGIPIRVSKNLAVQESLVAVSLPARVASDAPDLLDFIKASQTCQAVRRSGSAALNLVCVANGSLDAFWATHIHAWDVAAGVLLIREAGGVVTGRNGVEFNLWNPHFLAAANRHLHANLLSLLGPIPTEPTRSNPNLD